MDRPPPRVLVVVAGCEGATREIAAVLARDMCDVGVEARVADAGAAPGPEGYDAVVISSAVDYGRWLAAARRYAARHAAVLTSLPVWLLSTAPLGSEALDEEPPGVAAVRLMTGAREHLVVGGRLERDRLGSGERLVARVAGHGADRSGGAPVATLAAGIAGAVAR